VAVTGSWTDLLDPDPVLKRLPQMLQKVTAGLFNIAGTEENEPEFVLIHDRRDGSCWLWRFEYGLRFVMAEQPVLHDDAA
jgi:hypothetical protein